MTLPLRRDLTAPPPRVPRSRSRSATASAKSRCSWRTLAISPAHRTAERTAPLDRFRQRSFPEAARSAAFGHPPVSSELASPPTSNQVSPAPPRCESRPFSPEPPPWFNQPLYVGVMVIDTKTKFVSPVMTWKYEPDHTSCKPVRKPPPRLGSASSRAPAICCSRTPSTR